MAVLSCLEIRSWLAVRHVGFAGKLLRSAHPRKSLQEQIQMNDPIHCANDILRHVRPERDEAGARPDDAVALDSVGPFAVSRGTAGARRK